MFALNNMSLLFSFSIFGSLGEWGSLSEAEARSHISKLATHIKRADVVTHRWHPVTTSALSTLIPFMAMFTHWGGLRQDRSSFLTPRLANRKLYGNKSPYCAFHTTAPQQGLILSTLNFLCTDVFSVSTKWRNGKPSKQAVAASFARFKYRPARSNNQ
jgi:hypothetical protein